MRNGFRTSKLRMPRLAIDERGFALPTVLLMVFTAFAMGTVAVLASIGAQHGTSRDFDTKTALAGAEAGVHDALLRYNAAGGTWNQCLPAGATPVTIGTTSWCPSSAPVSLPDGTTYTYRLGFPQQIVGAPAPPHAMQVVAQGTRGGVTRRVDVTAASAAGQQPFSAAGIIGLNSIQVDQNGSLFGDSATNGDLALGGSNHVLCGSVEVGPGHDILPAGSSPTCGGTETQGVTSLPPVNQGNVTDPSVNQNANFFAVNRVISGSPNRACFNGFNATGAPDSNCGPRELVLRKGAANSTGLEVSLNAGNYSFCKLVLEQGTTLSIANGAKVTIYFDAPEPGACNYSSGVVQMDINQNSSIVVNGGTATNVRLLFVGSDALATKVVMSSNTTADVACNQDFVVYGPRTDIELRSNSYFCGAIAGKTVHVDQNTTLRTSNSARQYPLPNWVDHYAVNDFKECIGAMPINTVAANSGC